MSTLERYGRDPVSGKKPAFAGDSGVAVWHYTEDACLDCVDEAIRRFCSDE